jgi:tetratricopeptide (TPR) repeat protein
VIARTTPLLHGTLDTVAVDRLAAVENDVRAALDFALNPAVPRHPDRVAVGFQLLLDLTKVWYRFGRVSEARRWQEQALAVADEDQGPATIGLMHGLGMSLLQQGDVAGSTRLFDRCLAMAEARGDRDAQARALNSLAIGRRQECEFAASMALLHRSLAVSRETGNTHLQALALGNLVVVHIELGEFAQAARVAQESIRVNQADGDDWGVAIDRLHYAAAILKIDGARAAYDHYAEWAATILTFNDLELDLDLMELGAAILSGLHEPALAARLLGGADTRRAAIPLPRSAAEEALMTDWLSLARS